uniref:Thioredoxin domain-containing protein n=1 Tax=Oryza meridionalis TaxID=40149 RepID=A0A0E0DE87_9ORYZ
MDQRGGCSTFQRHTHHHSRRAAANDGPQHVLMLQVVANFSASWCGPCRVIAPIYTEMSKTYPQLMFLTIDMLMT